MDKKNKLLTCSWHYFYSLLLLLLSHFSHVRLCETPIDGSPPGSAIPRIPQARTLEWVTISFSNAWKLKVKVKSLSWVPPSATQWTSQSIGEGNGNPLQCSCLGNPGDGGAWWAAVYGVSQSRTRLKWLSSSSSSRREVFVLSQDSFISFSPVESQFSFEEFTPLHCHLWRLIQG